MRHVDEGDLHAWLDGALDQLGEARAAQVREHLRVCASCREILIAEEGLRARANEVLALAAPKSIDAPPFEALLERARATPVPEKVVRPRISRGAQLGWAASVVLALGAGWMAREIGVPNSVGESEVRDALRPVAPASEVAAPSNEVATAGDVAPAASVTAEVRSAPAAGSVAAERPVAVTRERTAGPARSSSLGLDEIVVTGNGSQGVVAADVAERENDPVETAPAAPAPEPAAARVASTPAPRPEPVAAPPVQVASAEAKAAQPTASVASAPSPTAPTANTQRRDAGTGMGAPMAASRTVAVLSRRPRPGEATYEQRSSRLGIQVGPDTTSVPQLFGGRSRTTARSSEVSTQADVDEAVDLIVPDLPVLKVEWTQVTPGGPGLRVLQRLSPTDTLEVRFVRSGGAAADAAVDPLGAVVSVPLPAGWSQAVRIHRDGWLVARAPLKQEELEALLTRAGSKR